MQFKTSLFTYLFIYVFLLLEALGMFGNSFLFLFSKIGICTVLKF